MAKKPKKKAKKPSKKKAAKKPAKKAAKKPAKKAVKKKVKKVARKPARKPAKKAKPVKRMAKKAAKKGKPKKPAKAKPAKKPVKAAPKAVKLAAKPAVPEKVTVSVRAKMPCTKAAALVNEIHKYIVPSTHPYPLVIKGGNGCYLQDIDGNWFLDFSSQVASTPLGCGHPAVKEAIARVMEQGMHKIAGQDFYCEEHYELARKLVQITPKHLSKVFLSNTGAEAVENALKFAYRKMGPLLGISCIGAFHGRTLGALSFTYSKDIQKTNYPQLRYRRIPFCTSDTEAAVQDVHSVVDRDTTAFIIAECIQGEGGYRIASQTFMKTLEQAARSNNVALIIDEVQSGMGRTGKWWSFEHYGIKPDIVSAGKSLQVGATISSEEWAIKEPGAVSTTWGGGGRIDMAVGLEVIKAIEKGKLLLNATKMGKYTLDRLREFENFPGVMGYDGLGLMLRVDFKDKDRRNAVLSNCFKKGLVLLGCGNESVRILPPMTVGKEEIDQGLNILEQVIREGKKR